MAAVDLIEHASLCSWLVVYSVSDLPLSSPLRCCFVGHFKVASTKDCPPIWSKRRRKKREGGKERKEAGQKKACNSNDAFSFLYSLSSWQLADDVHRRTWEGLAKSAAIASESKGKHTTLTVAKWKMVFHCLEKSVFQSYSATAVLPCWRFASACKLLCLHWWSFLLLFALLPICVNK